MLDLRWHQKRGAAVVFGCRAVTLTIASPNSGLHGCSTRDAVALAYAEPQQVVILTNVAAVPKASVKRYTPTTGGRGRVVLGYGGVRQPA